MRLAMSLPTLPKVQKLQDALYAQAKGSPEYRFDMLYDKVYRADLLWKEIIILFLLVQKKTPKLMIKAK